MARVRVICVCKNTDFSRVLTQNIPLTTKICKPQSIFALIEKTGASEDAPVESISFVMQALRSLLCYIFLQNKD